MKYLLLLTFSILLFACKTEIPEVEIISIDYNSSKEIKLSDFVKDFKIVRLETNDKCIVGQINKIQFYDNKIFILDQLSNSVFVFSKDGKFLNVLNKTGVGPGEYITAFDFNVTDKGIFLCDPGKHQILHYDFSFNFIDHINFPVVSLAFAMENGSYFVHQEPMTGFYYQLLLMDKTGKTVNEFLPQEIANSKIWGSSNMFQKSRDSLYFSPRHGNSIYKWNSKKWDEILRLSFGNKTFTGNVCEVEELYDDFPFMFRNDFFVLNNYIVISYNKEGLNYCFYNPKTKETLSGIVNNDLIPGYEIFIPSAQCDNYLIDVVHTTGLDDFEEVRGLKQMESLKDVTDDDNPILIMYEFK